MILHSYPSIEDKIVLPEIKKVFGSKMLAQGKIERIFSEKLTHYLGGYQTGCVGSGTSALLLALKILRVEKGDEVVLPSLVCQSVLEAVLASSATPVLCDVGEDWVVTFDSIKTFVTRKTKVIIVPHLYGIKADVKAIQKLGFPLIEDCAQAFGRTIDNKRIGIDGDLSVFSFHPTKCLTTGEGGAVMVNHQDKSLVRRLFQLRDSTKNLKREIFAPLSDISAAIGLTQLKEYDNFLQRRFQIAKSYHEVLKVKKEFIRNNNHLYSSMYFRYPIKIKKSFSYYAAHFFRENIIVRRGVNLLLHRLLRQDTAKFKQSEYLFRNTLSIPIYPALSNVQFQKICKAIDKIIE